jgi:hypothetical protein
MNLQVISPASTATSCRSPSRCPAPSATWPLHDPGKILTDLAAEEPQRSVPAWAVASVRRFYQANGCLLYADPHVTRVDRT